MSELEQMRREIAEVVTDLPTKHWQGQMIVCDTYIACHICPFRKDCAAYEFTEAEVVSPWYELLSRRRG